MNDTIQKRMLLSLQACLIPMVRVLLRYGITYRQFAEIGKAAFVKEALEVRDDKGRTANGSTVSVRTGLSRKEVRRIREEVLPRSNSLEATYAENSGPPARVLHAWHSEKRYIDSRGSPKPLYFDEGSVTFADLVRAVAGDVPAGSVRTELVRAGAVAELSDGRIVPTKRYYIPGNVDEKALTTMIKMLAPLAEGIAHNTNPLRTTDGFIQRVAFTGRLTPEATNQFRKWSRGEAQKFVESMDDWIGAHESTDDARNKKRAGQSKLACVGVFYYEGDDPSSEN